MYNKILDETRSAVAEAGVPSNVSNAIADLLFSFPEDSLAETVDELLASEIDADNYYDFLESWESGHRRFRKWVNEKKIGDPVKLTKEGRRVCLNVIQTTSWKDAFKQEETK